MRHFLCIAALLFAGQAFAQQSTTTPGQPADPAIRRDTIGTPTTTDPAHPGTFRESAKHQAEPGQQKVVRASKIIGLNVKNRANESLGSINDIVLDPRDGRVVYAAVSMGGFLGVGDKLFAVPWEAIECREENGEHVAFLDVDKERMKNAQGFDQDRWPDMASQQWRTENDRHYQAQRQTREVFKPVQPGTQQHQQPGQPGTRPAPQPVQPQQR